MCVAKVIGTSRGICREGTSQRSRSRRLQTRPDQLAAHPEVETRPNTQAGNNPVSLNGGTYVPYQAKSSTGASDEAKGRGEAVKERGLTRV